MKTLVVSAALATLLGYSTTARAQDTDACINASERAVASSKADKLIDARASLAICAASSCPEAVRASCLQRIVAINLAIPSIVVVAKDTAGHDLAAIELSVDGVPYPDRGSGRPIVLDPGEHEFRIEASGHIPVVQRFVLRQGEQGRRETLVVGDAGPSGSLPADARTAHGGPGAQRVAGLVTAAVGIASLAAGAVLGGLSLAAHSSYEKECGSRIGAPEGSCDAAGVSGQKDAALKGTLSTAFFIAGGVVTGAGAVLWLTAPGAHDAVRVGVAQRGLLLRGTF